MQSIKETSVLGVIKHLNAFGAPAIYSKGVVTGVNCVLLSFLLWLIVAILIKESDTIFYFEKPNTWKYMFKKRESLIMANY